MFINENLYKEIIKSIPILCVDIIVKNEKNQFLLVNRDNEPLKGNYWPPGGRVNVGETAMDAAQRKLIQELSIETNQLDFIGVYEGIFNIDPFDKKDIVYHTVGMVFQAQVHSSIDITLDHQSSSWKWSDSLPENYKILQKIEN